MNLLLFFKVLKILIQWTIYLRYGFKFNEDSDYSEENTSGNEDFCSAILESFQFELELKKMCGNESNKKEAKHIYASSANLLHIRIGNINWSNEDIARLKQKKKIFLCCWEVEAMLFALAKIPEYKGSILQSRFYRHFCSTIGQTCQPYLPSRFILSVPGVTKRSEDHGGIKGFIFLFLVLVRLNEKWNWLQDFLLLPHGFESFPSDLPWQRYQNLMCGVFVDD